MNIERIEVLLIIAAVVAIIARKAKVPYTVGLVLAGVCLGLLPLTNNFELTKDLIFTALLPPLVFEAAYHLRWTELKKDLVPITLFATVGVGLSALVVGWVMMVGAGWQLGTAAIFAILISATDPVSVIATFKDVGLSGRLKLLVEAESLMNDGTAAVGFGLVLVAVQGSPLSPFGAVTSFVAVAGGGILVGVAVSGLALMMTRRTDDHLVEITVSAVAAYGSFLVAEHFHLSGVLASVVAGIMIGNVGPMTSLTARGHQELESFWEFAAFVANSLIFLLMGIREAAIPVLEHMQAIILAIVAVTAGRAVAVYLISVPLRNTSWSIPMVFRHILFWGGLRGALALALVLGLPYRFPFRETITSVAFGVVAFSVVVQGLTMKPLMKRLGLVEAP